jgi:hypothetical protein
MSGGFLLIFGLDEGSDFFLHDGSLTSVYLASEKN